MNIYFLTQEEPFYLPGFFVRFMRQKTNNINIVGASIFPPFNSQRSWSGVMRDYLHFYGLKFFIRQSLYFLRHKTINFLKIYKFTKEYHSVLAVFRDNDVPIINVDDVNAPDFIDHLKKINYIDFIISIACPKILKPEIIAMGKQGCINLHNGYLPRYRGINPIFWTMLNGESKTAMSIHYITTGIDEGDLILQKELAIEKGDSLDVMYRKIVEQGPCAVLEALDSLNKGTAVIKPNKAGESTYFGFPTKEDGEKFRKMGLKYR